MNRLRDSQLSVCGIVLLYPLSRPPQRKLDSEREQSQVAAAAYDGQIRELRGQLETELRAHQASRESMGEMRLENERTKMKLENLERSNPDVENAVPSGASSASITAAAGKKNAAAAKSAKDKSSADPEEVAETQESADQTIAAQSKTISTLRSQTDQYKRHVIQVRLFYPIISDVGYYQGRRRIDVPGVGL